MFICAATANSYSQNSIQSDHHSIKLNDLISVEELPNSKELPNEYEEFQHLRQRRTVVFRPLFAYRQEQIEKRRIETDIQRRRDERVHQRIDTDCSQNIHQHKQNINGNCHCHCN